jgi:hypothetical protein
VGIRAHAADGNRELLTVIAFSVPPAATGTCSEVNALVATRGFVAIARLPD